MHLVRILFFPVQQEPHRYLSLDTSPSRSLYRPLTCSHNSQEQSCYWTGFRKPAVADNCMPGKDLKLGTWLGYLLLRSYLGWPLC